MADEKKNYLESTRRRLPVNDGQLWRGRRNQKNTKETITTNLHLSALIQKKGVGIERDCLTFPQSGSSIQLCGIEQRVKTL
jgi:hypothetical protein